MAFVLLLMACEELLGASRRMRTGFVRCHGELGRSAQADEATDRDQRSCLLVSRSTRAFVSKRFARRSRGRRSGPRSDFSQLHPCLIGRGRMYEKEE
jgi:hypothetical protein